jgi:hypothetical protein
MRFKIEIEERYQTHQDSYGQPFFAWRTVFSTFASYAEDGGLLIRYSDKVTPKMRAIGNGRIFTFSKVETIMDGKTKFSKLVIGSVRGDYACTREANKLAGLPEAQDEHGKDTGDLDYAGHK